jgi:hypothetical protein
VRVVSVIPGGGAMSPVLNASWVEIMTHMNRRMQFVDPAFHLDVLTAEELMKSGVSRLPNDPDLVFVLNINDDAVGEKLEPYLQKTENVVCLNSTLALSRMARIRKVRYLGWRSRVWRLLPFNGEAKRALKLFDTVLGFWERGHSDDLLYSLLVVINGVITDIPAVSEILKPVTLDALKCMVCNCRSVALHGVLSLGPTDPV